MAGLLFFNSVISNTGKRWSSTLIIFVALNHVKDRGQQGYISRESRKVSWEGNEIVRLNTVKFKSLNWIHLYTNRSPTKKKKIWSIGAFQLNKYLLSVCYMLENENA